MRQGRVVLLTGALLLAGAMACQQEWNPPALDSLVEVEILLPCRSAEDFVPGGGSNASRLPEVKTCGEFYYSRVPVRFQVEGKTEDQVGVWWSGHCCEIVITNDEGTEIYRRFLEGLPGFEAYPWFTADFGFHLDRYWQRVNDEGDLVPMGECYTIRGILHAIPTSIQRQEGVVYVPYVTPFVPEGVELRDEEALAELPEQTVESEPVRFELSNLHDGEVC